MAKTPKSVETITHEGDTRTNIPTAEYENLMRDEDKKLIELKYPRNPDLDPQLVWRGKDDQDWSDLVVTAPPLYIQEKINPKHIIDDLMRQSKKRSDDKAHEEAPDLFADMFDDNLDMEAKTEFYAHDQNWTNRMILGDSLQVMASLAEREGLRGKVQCIYFDPPYGIKFGSNWQVSTQSQDVTDGKVDQITREPEMVKAFRDTWSDKIHSYLNYARDRLTVSRDLLTETGSIFVQIGPENVHRMRALLDEVFGDENFLCMISVLKSTGVIEKRNALHGSIDYILQYAKNADLAKFRPLFKEKSKSTEKGFNKFYNEFGEISKDGNAHSIKAKFDNLKKQGPGSKYEINFKGKKYTPGSKWWGFSEDTMSTLIKAGRIGASETSLYRIVLEDDYPVTRLSSLWNDVANMSDMIYVVQTNEKIVERCILMTTDPGDLVLDPTCGSGTTASVSEKHGRRWITIDTSRVAISLAKMRITSNEYPYFLLSDSEEGKNKLIELGDNPQNISHVKNQIRQGFVYKRVPHITLKEIGNNKEIDQIWLQFEADIKTILKNLSNILGYAFDEWDLPNTPHEGWPNEAKQELLKYWDLRRQRHKQISLSINKNADFENLYDQPYEDNSKVRVAGPFTVESLSPHKVIAVNEDGEFLANADAADGLRAAEDRSDDEIDFGNVILEHLRTAGVQQAHKADRIKFTSINPFPGKFISGDGRYVESDSENAPQKRAAIFIGPEYGTLGRADIVAAAREARDLQFDVLVCCAFNYDAHSSEIDRLADLPILKARMNPDLHMADELKNTGAGNLFVVFGEPDIDFIDAKDGKMQVKINGVDVFHPSKGEVVSGGPESIAAWFIDTDYNEESFFVRHAYFIGANDPYKQLKSALKAEIDEEAWESLYREISRPFPKPETGRIAVKVINHLGDEVMKVFKLQ